MYTKTPISRILILLALTPGLLMLSRSGSTQDKTQTPDKSATSDKQSTSPASPSQSLQKFPFELAKNPRGIFHFEVKQPGSIAISVTATAPKDTAPTVQILGPGNTPVLTGDVNTSINYTVTAADVKRGTGWLVRVLPKRLKAANAKPPAPAPTQRFVFTPGRSKKNNFSFTVTHTGPITVDVKTNLREQTPLLLRLQGPNGAPTITSALDSTINYTVTEDDLSRGRFWAAQIIAAPPKTTAQTVSKTSDAPTIKSNTTPTVKPNTDSTVKKPTTSPDTTGPQKIQLSVAHNRFGYFSVTITKPGPVTIEVTGSPKPQPVHISGPKNTPALTGTTGKPISYTVTAADIKRGEFWTVQVTMPKK